MSAQITVGISDLNIARGGDILVTHALGSCVGICLYDTVSKVAGMSHILLPSIKDFRGAQTNRHKFADTAIEALIVKMEAAGAKKIFMRAKIAGGAQMFAATGNNALSSIGQRNVQAVKMELKRLGVPIFAEDTGQNYGRTQYFSSANGEMKIKSVNRGEQVF